MTSDVEPDVKSMEDKAVEEERPEQKYMVKIRD